MYTFLNEHRKPKSQALCAFLEFGQSVVCTPPQIASLAIYAKQIRTSIFRLKIFTENPVGGSIMGIEVPHIQSFTFFHTVFSFLEHRLYAFLLKVKKWLPKLKIPFCVNTARPRLAVRHQSHNT